MSIRSFAAQLTRLIPVIIMVFAIMLGSATPAWSKGDCAQLPPQRTAIEGADSRIYKSIDGNDLRLHVFQPKAPANGAKQAAIVFFFGGGWMAGTVEQFVPQARYLATRGMVAIVADYRVLCRQNSTPFDSVIDGMDAIRYIRSHAGDWNIDPNRIAASGGSAGGHVALSTAVLPYRQPSTSAVSFRPNALVLFNPAIDLMSPSISQFISQYHGDDIESRISEISPFQHQPSTLPTLIMNGEEDTMTLLAIAKDYCGHATDIGYSCTVIGYPKASHGFFNPEVENGRWFGPTLQEMDKFLTSIGYLKNTDAAFELK